ncbi:hypothetical protein ACWM35_06630 [Neobacillus sp. K501]
MKLAQQLVADHIIESPYNQIHSYNYGELRNGMTCSLCHSFLITVGGKYIVCETCGCVEKIDDAVVRTVEELKLLCPEMKITTQVVYEWCKVLESKKQIRRILKENYQVIGKNHYSQYI